MGQILRIDTDAIVAYFDLDAMIVGQTRNDSHLAIVSRVIDCIGENVHDRPLELDSVARHHKPL